MPFEDIGPVEALLGHRTGAGTEAADHVALVVREGVSIAIVPARKALLVILARHDRALFGPLGLMGEHMGLEVADVAAAIGVRASAFRLAVLVIFVRPDAAGDWARWAALARRPRELWRGRVSPTAGMRAVRLIGHAMEVG